MSWTEERISTLEDSLQTVMKSDNKKNTQLSSHESRLEDLENRLRRNNVRLVGLPEWVEGNTPVEFIEKWLLATMGAEHFSIESLLDPRPWERFQDQELLFWKGWIIRIETLYCRDPDNYQIYARMAQRYVFFGPLSSCTAPEGGFLWRWSDDWGRWSCPTLYYFQPG